MAAISIKKCILGFFFLTYAFVTHPLNAVGLATGPSLGIAGFYPSFNAKPLPQKTCLNNLAFQVGWFAKLDIWLLYAQLNTLLILDLHKLSNNLDYNHFKYAMPFTVGTSVFSLFCPHMGLIFKQNIHSYILGLGVDLGHFLMDIDWEFGQSTVARKSINAILVNGDRQYRPGQLILRAHYNLLG